MSGFMIVGWGLFLLNAAWAALMAHQGYWGIAMFNGCLAATLLPSLLDRGNYE